MCVVRFWESYVNGNDFSKDDAHQKADNYTSWENILFDRRHDIVDRIVVILSCVVVGLGTPYGGSNTIFQIWFTVNDSGEKEKILEMLKEAF